MNLQQAAQMEMIQTMEIPECPAFGKAYDENVEECLTCIDAEDCKAKMQEENKLKKKDKPKKKVEVKKEEKKKEVKTKPIKVIGTIELKEISAATLYSDMEYVEIAEEKQTEIKKEVKNKDKGMKKPPFYGRGGKGNTLSYLEWLLYSGKWDIDEIVKKVHYYHSKYSLMRKSETNEKKIKTYVKNSMKFFVEKVGIKETITNGKIKFNL